MTSTQNGSEGSGTVAGFATVRDHSGGAAAADKIDYGPVMQKLRRHFNSGKTRPLSYRRKQLQGLRRMLTEHIDEFIDALRGDLRRHPQMCLFGDIFGSVTAIDDALDKMDSWAAPREKGGQLEMPFAKTRLVPQPKGVLLLITAWNFPVDFVFNGLSQMLAAGNCVIVKPSEVSVNVEKLFIKLIPQYLDSECVAVIAGAVPETTALLRERFDHICFTGNGFVGRIVHQAAAKHLTPVTLELGGKGPGIVTRNADVYKAAKRIVFSKFLNNGQICAAADYLLVERKIEQKFMTALRQVIKDYPAGELNEQNQNYCRLIGTRHFDRIAGLAGCDHKGEVMCGGVSSANRDTNFFPFTVILNPDPSSRLMKEEIFGPLLPILFVDSVDEAIDFVNSRETPLVSYVFTQNSSEAKKVMALVKSGTGAVNEVTLQFAAEHIPFGGVGESGMGRYHGIYGFDEFSHLKPVLDRGSWPEWTDPLAVLRYPPFSSFKAKMLRAAVLYKGPAISVLRKVFAFVGSIKNLALLYFTVVGMLVSYRQWRGLTPDGSSF